MDWFYADAGKQIGPIDEASFQGLVAAGIVRNETLVWHAGMANWQSYQTIHPVAQTIPPPPSLESGAEMRFCTECGRPYTSDELVALGTSMV